VRPAQGRSGRPPKWSKRQLIDGIRWRIRVGSPWRDVPALYGPWQTVYGLFRRWQRDGTWQVMLTVLQAVADAAGRITWDVGVDSTMARAHQHTAGARRDGDAQVESPGGVAQEPADHALGRSRGGLTTKLHLGCEQARRGAHDSHRELCGRRRSRGTCRGRRHMGRTTTGRCRHIVTRGGHLFRRDDPDLILRQIGAANGAPADLVRG
jgi:transposase